LWLYYYYTQRYLIEIYIARRIAIKYTGREELVATPRSTNTATQYQIGEKRDIKGTIHISLSPSLRYLCSSFEH